MAELRVQRRLAAIVVADVVGYSRLMEADEAGTLAALKGRRSEILQPIVRAHGGRVVKVMGDGVLIEFTSAVHAVSASLQLQAKMAHANEALPEPRRIVLRIGINLGDVIGEGPDIYGDGVNIAARLEKLAEPGGLCISASVRDEVHGKIDASFEDAGEPTLKNLVRPVRAFRTAGLPIRRTLPSTQVDRPSVAVLPFQNLSGDAEQEYFCDGVVEDIIIALAQFRHLHVIARNSSFTYKGKAQDIKQIGRELDVRYVVEGSVRRTGDRLRIAGQLISTSTGAHLWADRFDGTLADIFDLQDRVASSIVGAITPKVEEAEIERAKRKPTESLDAYDYYLRGLAVFDRTITNRSAIDDALQLFMKAVDRDPEFASAYARAARCYATRKSNGWMVDRAAEIAEAKRLATRAVELGWDDAIALSYGGYVLGYVGGDLEDGAACIDRALALNPNLAAALGVSSWVKACLGEADTAVEHAALAMRLSPLDPRLFAWQFNTGLAHFSAGRYDDAATWAGKSMRHRPNYASAMRVAAASHALAGQLAEAQTMIARLCEFDAALRLSNVADVLPPFRRPDDRNRYIEALRTAGLPE